MVVDSRQPPGGGDEDRLPVKGLPYSGKAVTGRHRATPARARAISRQYPFPYQTLSGVFATNSGIAPHAALPCPLAPPKHMHHVWVRKCP